MVGDRRGRRRGRPDQHRLQGRVPAPPAGGLQRGSCSSSRTSPIGPSGSSTRSRPSSTSWSSATPPRRPTLAPLGGAAGVGPTAVRRRASERPGHLHLHWVAPPGRRRAACSATAYHGTLSRQIGVCWRRTSDDVVWTPLPLFHFNAIVSGARPARVRRSVGDLPPVLGVELLVGDEPSRRHGHVDARHDGVPPRQRHRSTRAAVVGVARGQRILRLIGAAPLPVEIDAALRERFGVDTFSGAYGVTEASLVSWQPPGVENRPNAAGVINDEYFDVRIFDDDDAEQPRGTDGEIVLRPKRPHTMFEGYWGRPDATVGPRATGGTTPATSAGSTTTATSTSSTARPTTSGGEARTSRASRWSGSSCSTRRSRMSPCTRCRPSSPRMTLKITATVREGGRRWPRRTCSGGASTSSRTSAPRYIELCAELPRSPVGRVLKRDLREEPLTDAWWDAEASGHHLRQALIGASGRRRWT